MHIFNLVLSIFGLGGATLDKARIAYTRIVRFLLIFVLPSLLISYLLNIGVSRWDWWSWLTYIPYLMGLTVTIVFLTIAFSPDVLLGVGVANLLAKDPLWAKYKELLWLTVAWINIPFMYIGGIPAGANPFAVFAIIVTITIFSAISEKSIWKKVVRLSTVIILGINLLSLIGGPMWFWMTGSYISIGPSKSDIQLQRIEKAKQELDIKEDVKILEKIEKKIQDEEELTPSDKKFLEDMQERRLKNSLPTIVTERFSKMKEALKIKDGPPVITGPKEEQWNMEFFRGNKLDNRLVTVFSRNNKLHMEIPEDNTVFHGTLEGDCYQGTLTRGATEGTFNLCFSGETAYGNLSSNENLDFTMKRLS